MYVRTYVQMYTEGMAIDLMSVAELRARLADVLERIQTSKRPLYLTQRGQARAVLIPVRKFEALIEKLEYLDDSVEVLKAQIEQLEGKAKTRSWASVERDLRKRGRLPA